MKERGGGNIEWKSVWLDLLVERDMINNHLDSLRNKKKNEKEEKVIEPPGGREKFYGELKGSLYVDLGGVEGFGKLWGVD